MSTNETRPHETDGPRQAEWIEEIDAHGTWKLRHAGSGEIVELQPVGYPSLDRDAVYYDVVYREGPGERGERLLDEPLGVRADAREAAWEKATEVVGHE